MANTNPIFVDQYVQSSVELHRSTLNDWLLAFTPDANASRIHGFTITTDEPTKTASLEFGYATDVLTDVNVDITPGGTPASDPFTVTKSPATAWTEVVVGDIITLTDPMPTAQRGSYRVSSISGSSSEVLTLENNPGNTITSQSSIALDAFKWQPLFNVQVPPMAGIGDQPPVDVLNPTWLPFMDDQSKFIVLDAPLHVRVPVNAAGDYGNYYIHVFSGGY